MSLACMRRLSGKSTPAQLADQVAPGMMEVTLIPFSFSSSRKTFEKPSKDRVEASGLGPPRAQTSVDARPGLDQTRRLGGKDEGVLDRQRLAAQHEGRERTPGLTHPTNHGEIVVQSRCQRLFTAPNALSIGRLAVSEQKTWTLRRDTHSIRHPKCRGWSTIRPRC